MVGVRPFRRTIAAWEAAAVVADEERPPDRGRNGAPCASDVENLARAGGEDADHRCVTREAPSDLSAHRSCPTEAGAGELEARQSELSSSSGPAVVAGPGGRPRPY